MKEAPPALGSVALSRGPNPRGAWDGVRGDKTLVSPTYSVIFPAVRARSARLPNPVASSLLPRAPAIPTVSGKTVLLVDSHEDSRVIYATILAHHGIGVVAAAHLDDGVRLARESRPDVIFLEYALPRARAEEAVRRLRGGAGAPGIPVVALSTAFNAAERDAALSLGFTGYLLKPCPPLELLAEARRHLGVS